MSTLKLESRVFLFYRFYCRYGNLLCHEGDHIFVKHFGIVVIALL